MGSLAAFLFVVGVLVFVHELGHYLMARRFGVRVLTFSLGFGPKLLTVRRGGTDYCLGAIPLGGYVKMAGASPFTGSGQPGAFLSKPRWQRFLILAAGPAMNVLLAVVVTMGGLLHGLDIPAYLRAVPAVGDVVPGSPAARAGVRAGDRIVSAGGEAVPTWAALGRAIAKHGAGRITLVLEREGRDMAVNLEPSPGPAGIVASGLRPDVRPAVQEAAPGSAAARIGLQAGDVVVAVNGRPARLPEDVLTAFAGGPVDLTVRRNGDVRTFRISAARQAPGSVTDLALGLPSVRVRPGPVRAAMLAFESTAEAGRLVVLTLGGLVTGSISPAQIMGPVGIAQLAGSSAQAGWMTLLGVMAFISLNLGIFNLLPIPLLDGGHMSMLAVEGLVGRDLTVGARKALLSGGLVVMLGLMAAAVYNDIGRLGWLSQAAGTFETR